MKRYLGIFILIVCILQGCQKKEKEEEYSFLFWGFAIEGFPITKSAIAKVESETGLQPQMILFFIQWPEPEGEFQPITPSLNAIWRTKAIPCLSWEPMIIENHKEKTISYETILNGNYDTYLAFIADEAKQWQKPIIIRFAHEMNLERYHWGIEKKEEFGPQAGDIYIKMFQYIVTFFRNRNVSNVLWAFCPNVDSMPNKEWNNVMKYYPGHAYVDILGMDGYNWAITAEVAENKNLSWQSPWYTFEELFYPLYRQLKTISRSKPIIIFETSTADRPLFPTKSEWIKEAIRVAEKWKILGIIWFQATKEEDWRINLNNDVTHVEKIKNATDAFQVWLENYLKRKNKSITDSPIY